MDLLDLVIAYLSGSRNLMSWEITCLSGSYTLVPSQVFKLINPQKTMSDDFFVKFLNFGAFRDDLFVRLTHLL